MRHRIVNTLGFGNSSEELLTNEGNLPCEFLDDAVEKYFNEGLDFKADVASVAIGIEPAYQYQRLKIITIRRNKKESSIEDGYAWEAFGTGIRKKIKTYGEYKRNCKFTRFVDKWHPVLFGRSNEKKAA